MARIWPPRCAWCAWALLGLLLQTCFNAASLLCVCLTAVPASADATCVMQFYGWIEFPQTGNYTFYLRSDDGSRLWLDGVIIADNDGHVSGWVGGRAVGRLGGWVGGCAQRHAGMALFGGLPCAANQQSWPCGACHNSCSSTPPHSPACSTQSR